MGEPADRLRIVIVEDRPDDAELMQLSLRRAGIDFSATRVDNESDLRRCLEAGADLVISEHTLATFDGMRALAVLRDVAPDVPLIMISESLGEEFAVRAMRGGAADYLLKSQISRIAPAVTSVLEQRRLRADHARALEELKVQREQLEGVIESAMDAIVIIDSNQRITGFNTAAEAMFGYRAAAVLGRRVEMLIPDRFRPGHQEQVEAFGRSGLTRRRMGALGRVLGLRSDGSEFAIEASISSIASEGTVAYTAILRDVSERLWAEQERERLRDKLLQAHKLEGLGLLAGGIAHDFNNLLAAMQGNAEMAALHLRSEPEESQRLLGQLQKGVQQAAQLTRQLLAYAGKASIQPVRLDLSERVRDIVELLRSAAPKNVDLVLDLEGGLPTVEADPAQVQQLIMNLVLNAAEACGEAGGSVTIHTRPLEHDPRNPEAADIDLPRGCYVVAEVQDDGCGMDEATLARIFDPFFTTKPSGRGLGLAAVQGIVKAHGGLLTVDSVPESGSRFRIYLPTVAGGVARTTHGAVDDRPGRGRLLVVDDEPTVLEVMRLMLASKGFDVRAASTGTEALAVFRADPHRFDAVLLDMTMPDMSGEQLFHSLREVRRDVPAIFLSGYDRSNVGERVLKEPRTAFVAKPFTLGELTGTVREALVTG